MSKFIIYADEAWTHNSQPLNRYHNFFGGIFGEEKYIDRLTSDLNKIKSQYKSPNIEIKWSNLNSENIELYKALLTCLSSHIMSGRIRYRQMFKDRSYHYVGDKSGSDLDIQFKQYYQFLRLSFGFQYLDDVDIATPHHIILRLDNHSSQIHRNSLDQLMTTLPQRLNRQDIKFSVTYINSKNSICLQVCDLLMGSAGYYGNQVFLRRENGKKRITLKQKLKKEMCVYTYNILRNINNVSRGAMAFNWFESTGKDGDISNLLLHKLRIWKFISYPYKKNKGWERKSLDKYGLFIADNFDPITYKK